MPHPFDASQVAHIANLASISLTPEEAAGLARELVAIMAHVEELRDVDTSSVEAREGARSAWRQDVVVPGLSHEDALREAPQRTDAGFAVPGFVSGGGGATG